MLLARHISDAASTVFAAAYDSLSVHLVQAMISGAFSIVRQSINLGCFPRLSIKHTSEKIAGQIYIPAVNWTLMVLSIAVVAGFQSSTAIGNG